MRSKGQIQIVFLILVIIGVILFLNFNKGTSKNSPTTPSQGETSISSPEKKSPSTSPNPAPSSNPIPDTTPPYRFSPQPSGSLSSDTRQTFISLQTDENATCRYSDVSGLFYEYMQYTFSETGNTYHSTLVTGLSEGESYVYYIRCIDGQGNKNSDDFIIAFYVKKPDDYTPPVLRHPYPTGDILASGTTQTLISIGTDEPAYCRYSFTQGTIYNSMKGTFSRDDTKTYHTATIKNLENGKSYEYFVRCKDLAGNANTGDVMIYFSVR